MMKSFYRSGLLVVLIAALALTGCATNDDADSASTAPTQRRDLPDFFLNPPRPADQYVGLGMAKMADDNLARTTAVARARADIAAQVAVSVETMLTDYAQESGAGEDTQTLTFVESVRKEVANIELRGAVTQQQYPAVDGTWYAMVFFPRDAMLDEVETVFDRNEGAAFAEFQARQAVERLNAELETHPPHSAGVDSPVNQ